MALTQAGKLTKTGLKNRGQTKNHMVFIADRGIQLAKVSARPKAPFKIVCLTEGALIQIALAEDDRPAQ